MKPIKSIDDPRYVKAMSHPLRVRILAMLGERRASPNELAGLLGVTLGTVAYHVRTLERIGLIELVDETKVRGAIEHHYRARPRPTVSDSAWADASPIVKQAAVGSTLQVIDDYARRAAAAGGFDGPEAHITRTMLTLDPEGVAELSAACTELVARADQIAAAAKERLAADPHAQEVAEMGLAMLVFRATALTEALGGERRGSSRSRPSAARRGRAAAARARS
jgi:DNA-binding transcriptional ArsR family regulator